MTTEEKCEYNKAYRLKNREKLHEYIINWREQYKDTPEYKEKNRENGRKWFEANKEHRQNQIKEYDRRTADNRHERGKSAYGRHIVVKRLHNKRWQSQCLSLEEFTEITEQPCQYCRGGTIGGLDRVNNVLGYEKENVVSCCKVCNYMKNKLSLEEFKNHVKLIYENLYSDGQQ